MGNLFTLLFGPQKPQRTAQMAKERLLVVVARERDERSGQPDFLPALQRELLEVISRYVSIRPEDIKVKVDKQDAYEMLEVNIVLPETR